MEADSLSNYAENAAPTTQHDISIDHLEEGSHDLRQKRLDHFTKRTTKAPIRYRHSIGSPSLSNPTTSVKNFPEEAFGNEEIEGFLVKYGLNGPFR